MTLAPTHDGGFYNPRFVHTCNGGSFYISAVPPRQGDTIKQACPSCGQVFDITKGQHGTVSMAPSSAEGTPTA